MSKILINCKIQRVSILFSAIVVAPLLVALGCYVVIASISSGGISFITIVAMIIALLGLIAPFSESRYQLLVTDEFVQQKRWYTIKMNYSEVNEVDVQFRVLTLKAKGKKISTPGLLENRERALSIIAAQLKAVPGLKISGNKKRISELFG